MPHTALLVACRGDTVVSSRLAYHAAAVAIVKMFELYLEQEPESTVFREHSSEPEQLSTLELKIVTEPKIVFSYPEFVSEKLVVTNCLITNIACALVDFCVRKYGAPVPDYNTLINSRNLAEVLIYFDSEGPISPGLSEETSRDFILDAKSVNYKLDPERYFRVNLLLNYYTDVARSKIAFKYEKTELRRVEPQEIFHPTITESVEKILVYTDLTPLICIYE